MIVFDLQVGDSLTIGEATVTLREKSGRRGSIAVDAPREVKVERKVNRNPDTRIMSVEEIERHLP